MKVNAELRVGAEQRWVSQSSETITHHQQHLQAELEETLVMLMLREREITKVGPSVCFQDGNVKW